LSEGLEQGFKAIWLGECYRKQIDTSRKNDLCHIFDRSVVPANPEVVWAMETAILCG
jgi:hypothetical protein